MDTRELKPCPFCGGTHVMMFEPTCRKETPYNPADRLFPIVRCQCGAEAIGKDEDYRGATAIAAWNTRASDAEIERLREALKEAKADRLEVELNLKAKQRGAFRRALQELPEIAPDEVKSVLSSVHMRDEFFREGKRLQISYGTEAVSPRVEQECGAGVWSFMRAGILAALNGEKP